MVIDNDPHHELELYYRVKHKNTNSGKTNKFSDMMKLVVSSIIKARL